MGHNRRKGEHEGAFREIKPGNIFGDNQPAHPFSFLGRRAGKVLWTSGKLRLTVSTGVTRNSTSRKDGDHKDMKSSRGKKLDE